MAAELKPYPRYSDSGVEWLGAVPAHWEVGRLKGLLANVVDQGAESSTLGGTVVALENVESWTGRVAFPDSPPSFDSQLKLFRSGDVLFGKLRPYLAKVARPANDGLCVGEFLVLRPRQRNASGPYLERLLRSKPIVDAVTASTYGAKMPRADWGFIGGMPVVRPPLPEQAAIVRFLDHADRRIRRYIRAKDKLTALLEEQQKALIQDAVTGRLDVRTGRPYPTYRGSGVEWLGAVPAHWNVWRSKRVFRPRTELARPDDIQLSATQAYGVIAQADYEEKIGRKVTRILRHLEQRRHVEVDDFVISMRSFQGGLERAWRSGCIRSSYIVLQAAIRELSVGYFGHLFKSAGYIAALQSTADFIRDGQDLNFENFCRVDVPFPPIEEQHQIAHVVDTATAHIASSIERSRRQISSLREYQARLIADAVTGKVDVREAAAALPEPDPLAEEEDADSDSHRHISSEASGDAKDGGPLPHVVDTKRSGAVAGELMAEGR